MCNHQHFSSPSPLFLALILSLSLTSFSLFPLLFIPVSTLDRCALVLTCVGRWNIKHVISLGSNKMGYEFSPGTRMKKKFLHKLFQKARERSVFVTGPLCHFFFCFLFPSAMFLKDPLVFLSVMAENVQDTLM